MEKPAGSKEALRAHYKLVRDRIGENRRKEGARVLINALYPLIPKKGFVMSFVSFGSEIDTTALNERLKAEGRLVLPRVSAHTLVPCRGEELVRSRLGHLEPDPLHCAEVDPREITFVVVPGLAFDLDGCRLGYGRGHYDAYFTEFGNKGSVGIGFNEQLFEGELPRESQDIPVERVVLV